MHCIVHFTRSWTLTRFIDSCWTLYLAGKYTHLIAAFQVKIVTCYVNLEYMVSMHIQVVSCNLKAITFESHQFCDY